MKFLDNLAAPLQHCEDAAIQLCKILNVKVTRHSLQKDLVEHPNYPSLVSISDVLQQYGIANLALKVPVENFVQISIPFIAHIKAKKVRHSLFAVVRELDSDSVEFYNPESKKIEVLSKEDFSKIYDGVVLAVEALDNTGEKDYDEKQSIEKQKSFFNAAAVFSIPAIILMACITAFANNVSISTAPVLFTLSTLAGCLIAVLLLWHEIDEYNPTLKQICQAGKKVNCSAILNSKAAKVFGLSWSSIGFTYFMSMLQSLMAGGITNTFNLYLLSWVIILTLPFIIYSIYYQWQKAKQWCLLCLMVQGILLLQFITALVGGFYHLHNLAEVPFQSYVTITGSFATVFVALLVLMPALERAKESRSKTISLQRLKNNPQIFESLLAKQKSIGNSTDGLGITIGNPNAKYRLTKVCNPYCGPCAQAHPIMEELLATNEDLQLQIIFTATDREDDYRAKPVRHLLTIATKGNEALTKQALDDWYLAEDKNYDAFAAKYPLNGELKTQGEKLAAMSTWCSKTDIQFTPTFFVNGYQLPEMYSINDLKYFLSV